MAAAAEFTNFLSTVSTGSFVGYYQNEAGPVSYNGYSYSPLSALELALQVGVTTVASAGFNGGLDPVTNGQVTTFTVVVPEPGSLALVGLGLGLAALAVRRRRAG